jgi:uncharacterized protein (UPF0335 family)
MAEVTGGVSAEQLRSFIERLENLEEEKRAVQEQLKEVFAEAKGEGFDVKVIRQILRLRRQKPHERAELDELLEVYKNALGMM